MGDEMTTGVAERTSLCAAVYEAIDNSVALRRCLPSADAKVQRALAHFRADQGDPEAVRQLESMSVHLHQLAAASMRPRASCPYSTVRQLAILADQWMARLPMH
jgi:hypothetical protein